MQGDPADLVERHRGWARFGIRRRLPWPEEELRDHVDRVVDGLREVEGMEEIAVDVDLATARLEIVVFFAAPEVRAEASFRDGLGRAIRSAGAGHEGLLPGADESRLAREVRGPWSGLRFPTWRLHAFEVATVRR